MEKKELRRIGVLSLGKINGMFMVIIGLIIGLIVGIYGTIIAGFSSLLLIIIMPLIYGIIGFISGLIIALIYNLVASWIGGLELNFVVKDENSSRKKVNLDNMQQ